MTNDFTRPQIKICGLINTKDAHMVNKYLVNYAGMVLFFPKSKRNLTISQAKEVMSGLLPSIKKVAVTVSPTLSQVKEIEAAGFDILQVHGELSEEVLSYTSLPIFRAYNISDKTIPLQLEDEEKIAAYIYDGEIPGNGSSFDWNLLSPFREQKKRRKKLILAGGLHAGNIAGAIEIVHPDIVDVSSGVENPDGTGKDEQKIKAFVDAVRLSL